MIGSAKRDAVLTIVAALMIIFGIADAIPGFGYTVFGTRPTQVAMAGYLGAAMGTMLILGGTLILTAKKSAATVALSLLAVVILGHVALVATGLYPTDSVSQLFAVVLDTSIACAFFVAIALKWETFA